MKMNTSSNSQREERNDAEVQDGTHSSRLTYLLPAEDKHASSEAAEGDGTLSSRLTYLPPAEVMPAFSLHGGSNQWQLSSPKPLSWPDSFQS
jgi:hypothetical protein